MKKVSDLLNMYIILFFLQALFMAVYTGDKMENSFAKFVVLLVSVFFFIMGYKGTQAIGPLKEMEERDEKSRLHKI